MLGALSVTAGGHVNFAVLVPVGVLHVAALALCGMEIMLAAAAIEIAFGLSIAAGLRAADALQAMLRSHRVATIE